VRRARKLFSNLDGSIGAVLIVNSRTPFLDDNFRYLTDAIGGVFESSIAVATTNGVTIITSSLEEEIAAKSGCRVMVASDREGMGSELRACMKGKKTVGVNMSGISHAMMKWVRKNLKDVRLKDVSKQLSKTRMVKEEEEIARISKAASIASKVAGDIPAFLRPGITEKCAAAEVDYLLRGYGADGTAFETIVAFGPAAALPHHMPGNRRLGRGSVALFDFGASYMNYKSDMTRTFFTKPLNGRMSKIYEVVAEAQRAAISSIAPGVKAKRVDIAAREVIGKAGYAERFIHSTGHGLGISEHDPGVIAEKSKDILEKNMVVTIEPGIYLPGKGGIRIEDDVLVTRDGVRILTKADRGIIVI
jgi:Xaa-Pro aminopeptidase